MARDELTSDQRRDLEAHLQECESCSHLAKAERALESAFSSVKMSEPAPGFAQRWKIRLEERRSMAHRRQTTIILGLLSFGATALFLPLLVHMILVLISPEDLLFDLAKAFADWLSFLGTLGDIVVTFLRSLVSTIPILWVLPVLILLVGVILLSGFSLKQLGTLPSRKRSSR